MEELDGLPDAPIPGKQFDNSKLSMAKLDETLKRKRNASKSGPIRKEDIKVFVFDVKYYYHQYDVSFDPGMAC